MPANPDHRLVKRWCAQLGLSCTITRDLVTVPIGEVIDDAGVSLRFPWRELVDEQLYGGCAVTKLRGMVQAAAFGNGPIVRRTM